MGSTLVVMTMPREGQREGGNPKNKSHALYTT